jgi:curved DNA-binding protein
MEFRDYYTVLGVKKNASEKEIRAAFRKLARQHHPDVNPGNKAAEDRFKEINEANEVLSDPEKRALYDALGARWREYQDYRAAGGTASPADFARASQATPQAGRRSRGTRGATMTADDLRDIYGQEKPFSDFFGDVFGGRAPRASGPARGGDVEVPVEISLEDAFRGSRVTLQLTDPSGQARALEAAVPRGVHDGARVRLAGQGTPGRNGGPNGDLFMLISVRPHPVFTRDGDDLHTPLPVELTTCLLGGEVQLQTLKGTRLTVRIPPETQNGQVIRLRGQGMPTHVLGYYTLCAMAISQGDVPEAARKHVPRYPLVSATLIGRLAALRGDHAAVTGS